VETEKIKACNFRPIEYQYPRLTCEVWTLSDIAVLDSDPKTNETIKIKQCFKCIKENEKINIFNRDYSFDSSEIIDIKRKTTSSNNRNNHKTEILLSNNVPVKQSDNKFKIVLIILLITCPIWVLLFFHFVPDKISGNYLYENGIKTVAKIEFYTIEKESGNGKLGGLNKHEVRFANYIYRDNENNEFKGKVKSGLVPISIDSTLHVLFMKNNPRKHLVIKTNGDGILGKPRK